MGYNPSQGCNTTGQTWPLWYNRLFQQVIHKGGESEINYIKIFQDAKALAISVINSNSEYQFMHTFLYNYHQCIKYSAQIEIEQAELKREETFAYQKSLSISALKINYLNLENSVRNK